MELQDFINNFEEQYEKIEPGTITAQTEYKSVKGWDSLTAMLVIEMVNSNYGKIISANDFMQCKTVQELFDQIKNK